jgi:small subunit ribosomal protein S21
LDFFKIRLDRIVSFTIFAAQIKIENMIVVNVKENESIDKALKRFKKKFEKTGVLRELRGRTAFVKPSVRRREQVIRAAYRQHLQEQEAK